MQNPLLEPFENRDGAVPFDQIKTDQYLDAVKAAIDMARQQVQELKSNPESANFENTIEALETSGERLGDVASVYFNLFSAEASEEHQKLAGEISAMTSAYSNEVGLDADLFARIKSVYDNKDQWQLDTEKSKLLEKTYRDFARNGALLADDKKEELKKIDEEMAQLSPKFSENLLKATNSFQLHITNEADLDGLSDSIRESAQADAKAKELDGWIFTLQYPSYVPFMKYAKSSELREKMYRAFRSRGMGEDVDNRPLNSRIVELRHQRARLLGFKSHADYVLQERMAETTDTVMGFLDRILNVAKPAAEKEFTELKEFAKKYDGIEDVKPWDVSYYSEKLKEEKYQFNEEELKPWFPLEQVIDGAFSTASQLYRLVFKPIDDVPVYHTDVKTYEVHDDQGNYIGLFYADFFPRETKRSGAWMTTFREQGLHDGEVKRPHVSIVCNFTKPTGSTPSLLTLNEVRTLFHEFGHALHGLLSKCRYQSLSGPNVYWDFVELPSQLMENWVMEKEGLSFAKHYQTGEPLPDEMIEKIKASAQFHSGMFNLVQLGYGMLDMAWHADPDVKVDDVEAFENDILAKTSLYEPVDGTALSPGFSHIFAGGYSAGYYSYKWAEVLDADAFEFFKEKGIFNREVADLFRENILERGGTEHPMELYKKFRGRQPDPDALLRRDGLL